MVTNKSKLAVLEVEQKLQAFESRILQRTEVPLEWIRFDDNQNYYQNSLVHVTNADFANGTLRIKEPCVLKLQEPILFAPNANQDHFPTPEQLGTYYDKFSYRLGFFTAITVETTECVVIDLNGYTLAASELFALQQRFQSLIELGDQPFNPQAGPSDFGADIRVAKNVWIKNGTLGRTSHHGIHGNGCENIVISDITFKDYEVAAISLNGCRKIYVKNCQCDGTNVTTPVLGTYSAARFCSIFGKQALDILNGMDIPEQEELHGAKAYLQEALQELDQSLNSFLDDFDKVLKARDVRERTHALHNLKKHAVFYNGPQLQRDDRKFYGLTDGNCYGIAFHSRGPLVNSFNCPGEAFENISDLSKALETTDVVLERVNISSTQGNIREIPALAEIESESATNTAGKRQLKPPFSDISGAVFQFFGTFDGQRGNRQEDGGHAALTALGKAQIALADIKLQFLTIHAQDLEISNKAAMQRLSFLLGRSNIPKEIIDWAKGAGTLDKVENTATDYQLGSGFQMQVLCNGDTMHHVNKGCIGLFIQSVDGLMLDNVIVSGVKNTGYKGGERAGRYFGSEDGGHKSQGNIVGYSGADARGIYIGACSNVEMKDPKVFSVTADYGSSFGIEVANGNHKVLIQHPFVANCHAGSRLENDKPQLPNKPCITTGLLISNNNSSVKLIRPKIEGTFSQAWVGPVDRVKINSMDTEIVSS